MGVTVIPVAEGEVRLDWHALCDAIERGHQRPKAEIADSFLYRDTDTLLSRAAWLDGLGVAVQSATICTGNAAQNQPTVHGAVTLFSDDAVPSTHLTVTTIYPD